MAFVFRADVDLEDPAVSLRSTSSLWSALAGRKLLDYLSFSPRRNVLDLGCGTGFPTIELAERLGRRVVVTGVDHWASGLERARAKAAARDVVNVSFVEADAVLLPFRDGDFDLIVSNLGINNFDEPARVMRECRRVAGNGATLALTTNLRGHWSEFYAIFESVIEVSMRPALARHVAHRSTIEGLRALLEASLFDFVRLERSEATMRSADGTAFLNHSFVRLGFAPAWKALIPESQRERIFADLETALNDSASALGGLTLSVPLAYVEAVAR